MGRRAHHDATYGHRHPGTTRSRSTFMRAVRARARVARPRARRARRRAAPPPAPVRRGPVGRRRRGLPSRRHGRPFARVAERKARARVLGRRMRPGAPQAFRPTVRPASYAAECSETATSRSLHHDRRGQAPVAFPRLRHPAVAEGHRLARREAGDGGLRLQGDRQVDPRLAAVGGRVEETTNSSGRWTWPPSRRASRPRKSAGTRSSTRPRSNG